VVDTSVSDHIAYGAVQVVSVDMTFTRTLVFSNTASHSAFRAQGSSGSHAAFEDCVFNTNMAQSFGGAALVIDDVEAVVSCASNSIPCTALHVVNNTARQHEEGRFTASDTLELTLSSGILNGNRAPLAEVTRKLEGFNSAASITVSCQEIVDNLEPNVPNQALIASVDGTVRSGHWEASATTRQELQLISL